MLLIFVRNSRQKLELTDMRDAECVQEIANFSQVLPSYLVQSHKKQPIYMDVTYFLHISFIYSYSSPFTLSRVTKNNLYIIYMDVTYSLHISFTYSYISKSQKQPTFIYLDITYFLNIYILHISYHSPINILIPPPFSFRGTKKRPILTSHIFSLCFSHFLSYINFPSLLVQLYKRQPIYGGHIFLHPSHILLSHVSKFSPSLRSGSESKKTDGVQKNSQYVVHAMLK